MLIYKYLLNSKYLLPAAIIKPRLIGIALLLILAFQFLTVYPKISVANISISDDLKLLPRDTYNCSVGGVVSFVRLTSDSNITDEFHRSRKVVQINVDANQWQLRSVISNFHRAYCMVEADQELHLRDLLNEDEVTKLVNALNSIINRQDIKLQSFNTAADLAIQLSSLLADSEQSSIARKEAIRSRLRNSIQKGDAASVEIFIDEFVHEFRSGHTETISGPQDFLDELNEYLGDISIEEIARVNPLSIQRTLYSFVVQFPEPENGTAKCSAATNQKGAVRALLAGIDAYENSPLRGPVNDIELFKKTLEIRGIRDIRMSPDISRDKLIHLMRTLVLDTSCGDTVLFHFSGHSTQILKEPVCGNQVNCSLKGWNVWPLLVDYSLEGGGLLHAAELSQFITAIRNRGANVAMFLDTNYAAGMDIINLQNLATPSDHTWKGRIIASDDSSPQEPDLGNITPVQDHAGDYAVFYATDASTMAYEKAFTLPNQERQTFGAFSYAVAQALQITENPTVLEMLGAIYNEYRTEEFSLEHGRIKPVLDATDPKMLLFQRYSQLKSDTLDIEIISPRLVRGARPINSPRFEISGILNNRHNYANFTVDLVTVEVASNGQFSAEIELKPGRSEIHFAAIDFNYRFHTKTIKFELSDDLEHLARQGRKYALVIGNQDYTHDQDFHDLTTPHGDAKAIAALLKKKYSFETSILSRSGKTHELIILDAKEREIHSTIQLLKNLLTENDTLIVYYAGHGIYQKDIERAYWLPVDAVPDQDYTWIKATDLTDKLKQFTARNILVVADSCYSGAMAKREVPELKTLDENRRKALLKAATRKSRILLSSGGTEPVLDGGGKGHSVFARAFITALEKMDKDIFSSREIYNQFIYPMVQGTENQEPQHRELEQSGHEGGDVIFMRAGVGIPGQMTGDK